MGRNLGCRAYFDPMGSQEVFDDWDEGQRWIAPCEDYACCGDVNESGGHVYRLKNPPNRLPPAPPFPCLAASVSIHFFKKARDTINGFGALVDEIPGLSDLINQKCADIVYADCNVISNPKLADS